MTDEIKPLDIKPLDMGLDLYQDVFTKMTEDAERRAIDAIRLPWEYFGGGLEHHGTMGSRMCDKYLQEIHQLLNHYTIKDDAVHLAEPIIEKALKELNAAGPPLLRFLSAVFDPSNRYEIDLLHLIGRVGKPHIPLQFKVMLIKAALRSQNSCIRCEAMSITGIWGDEELISLLTKHHDPENWIQEYVDAVLEDYRRG